MFVAGGGETNELWSLITAAIGLRSSTGLLPVSLVGYRDFVTNKNDNCNINYADND